MKNYLVLAGFLLFGCVSGPASNSENAVTQKVNTAPQEIVTPQKTQAQLRRDNMHSKLVLSLETIKACIIAVRATDEFARLDEKYVFRAKTDSDIFTKNRNKEYATSQDKDDMLAYVKMFNPCMAHGSEQMTESDVRLANVMTSHYYLYDENISKLIDEDITVGDYNKNRISIYNNMDKAYIDTMNEIKEEFDKQHNAEIEQRQKAAMLLLNMYMQNESLNLQQQQINQQQQLIQQKSNTYKPITTNCSFEGIDLNCTSY